MKVFPKYLILVFLISFAILLLVFNLQTNYEVLKSPHKYFGFILGQNNKDNITVILTGDVMLGRSIMTKSLGLNDHSYPFRKVAKFLKEADIAFINLENPIIEDCPWTTTGMIFCAEPKMIEGLIFAGIDIANLANNHTKNYGQAGLNQTISYLNQANISLTGLGHLVIKKVNNTKFGFLGFDFLTNTPAQKDFDLIKESDSKADILIVAVHWGAEYQSKASKFQKEIAKKLVDAGADVVVGHHPHVIQEVEYIKDKPVYYSLGNFVFDQMWSEQTKKGLVVRLTFDKNGKLIKEEKLPIYMSSWAQPEFVK